jgi:hypothetical protein
MNQCNFQVRKFNSFNLIATGRLRETIESMIVRLGPVTVVLKGEVGGMVTGSDNVTMVMLILLIRC